MYYRSMDPATGELLAEFPSDSTEATGKKIDELAESFRSWSQTEVSVRAAFIRRVAGLYRDRREELALLTASEIGKPLAQARGEVLLSADIYDYYADNAEAFLAPVPLEHRGGGSAYLTREAIGTLLGIMPWNFPYYQVARFAAPNLVLGNTVLLKHARNCPRQARVIQEIFDEAAAGMTVYLNSFVESKGVEGVLARPEIQGVSLTGSEGAGRAVATLAGTYLKKCLLELGGSDPLIVLPGSDLPTVAAFAAQGRYRNAGQSCVSSKRTLVHTDVWDDFTELFLAEAKTFIPADPKLEETPIGPLATPDGVRELRKLVDEALSAGATLVYEGATPDGFDGGNFFAPLVLTDVTPRMRAYHEELFGPVAVLYKFSSEEEALEIANGTRFGLGAAVFGDPGEISDSFVRRIEAGMVGVNTTIRTAPELPFGGVKASGIGRELGPVGIDEFANLKLVHDMRSRDCSSDT